MSLDGRDYWRCDRCEARFLDPRHRPVPGDQRAHCLLHENDAADPQYRRFLSTLADPLINQPSPASRGLDHGCGPGPALAAMLREAGRSVALYDLFFLPDPAPLRETYEFSACTGEAEQFHHPAREFERLRRLVRPGGWLAIMTCFRTDDARFADWHHRKEPIQFVFYRDEIFRHLAAVWGWTCAVPVKDVVLMRRPLSGAGA